MIAAEVAGAADSSTARRPSPRFCSVLLAGPLQVPAAEGGGHRFGHLRLGEDHHARSWPLRPSFPASRAIATGALGLAASHAGVRLGLIGLKPRADVLPHVDVGDIDRDDLKRGLGVEAAATRREMLSGFSITVRCWSAEPIAVMMPSPTRAMIVFGRPPIKAFEVGSHGHARGLSLDAVLATRSGSACRRPWKGRGSR